MQIGNSKFIGSIFRWFDVAMRWVSVTVGAFSKADASKFPDIFSQGILWLQKGWVLPVVLIVAPVAAWVRHKTDRGKLDAVHALLDQICDHTFKNENHDHEQNRRVTLFKYKKFTMWRWPFIGGWLIPIERSGDFTRNTKAIFRAPDDGEKCEGVCGRAWSKRSTVYVSNLPNLRKNLSDENIKEYAEKTFLTVARLKEKPPQACSLYGVPIEVGQKRWGVLVFDSVSNEIKKKAASTCLKQILPTLSNYLRGV